MRKNRYSTLAALVFVFALALPMAARAENQIYYLGSTVNAGMDDGYSKDGALTEKDPHYGWSLGRFYITGFTNIQREGDKVTFLKTAGDDIKLKFRLDQDVDRLNGDEALTINDDSNGYDQRFGITKSDAGFGRGTLIIRQTDYQNNESAPQVFVNYLIGVQKDAETDVSSFAEGDYEVVLDYEIKKDARKTPGIGPIPSISILPEYGNYTIRFNFSVRNGNAMVFLIDSETGSELTNSSVTENGFTVDFAKSRYLDIFVKRSVLSDNGQELVDIRSNEPASDGKNYTDPGIYTITAVNPSTSQTTEKVIYVGNNPLLKCYAITGYSLEQIQDMLNQGATISDDGSIVWPTPDNPVKPGTDETTPQTMQGDSKGVVPLLPIALVAITAIAGIVFAAKKHQEPTANQNASADADAESVGTEILDNPEGDAQNEE